MGSSPRITEATYNIPSRFFKPTLSASTYPEFEVEKTTLTMVQKLILDTKINKFVDRKEMMEENLKRVFTILHVKFTESVLAKLGG